MKAKFLQAAGFPNTEKGVQAFMKKFPTEESFFETYPQFQQLRKGGSPFPTQPTADQFFQFGVQPHISLFQSGGAKIPANMSAKDYIAYIQNQEMEKANQQMKDELDVRGPFLPTPVRRGDDTSKEIEKARYPDLAFPHESVADYDNNMVDYYYNHEGYSGRRGFEPGYGWGDPDMQRAIMSWVAKNKKNYGPGDSEFKIKDAHRDVRRQKEMMDDPLYFSPKKQKGGIPITQYTGEDIGQGRHSQVMDFIRNGNTAAMYDSVADEFMMQKGGEPDNYGWMGDPYTKMAEQAMQEIYDPNAFTGFLGAVDALRASNQPYYEWTGTEGFNQQPPVEEKGCGGRIKKAQKGTEVESYDEWTKKYKEYLDRYFKESQDDYKPGMYSSGRYYTPRPGGAPVASSYGYQPRDVWNVQRQDNMVNPMSSIDWSKQTPSYITQDLDVKRGLLDRIFKTGPRRIKYSGSIGFGDPSKVTPKNAAVTNPKSAAATSSAAGAAGSTSMSDAKADANATVDPTSTWYTETFNKQDRVVPWLDKKRVEKKEARRDIMAELEKMKAADKVRPTPEGLPTRGITEIYPEMVPKTTINTLYGPEGEVTGKYKQWYEDDWYNFKQQMDYQIGGEVEMGEDELAAFLQAGGQVEYLD